MPSRIRRACITLAVGVGLSGCSSSSTNPGETGTGGAAGQPIETIATITDDADDAVWLAGTNENLRTNADDTTIEIGNDIEGARAGLRFQLAVPRNANIESAAIELRRVAGPADATETLLVQVFDDALVPRFDDAHTHAPADHAADGLRPEVVGGFAIGEQDELVTSPDVGALVQRVVTLESWTEAGFIGFVLGPDSLETWATFRDSSGGVGARLRVVFVPP